MAGLVTLTGGTFQDAMGNLLSDGYLICELSQDEQLSSSQGQAVGGRKIKVLLGTDGNVLASPAQKVWPTDEMNPGNASYTVWGYTEEGQLVWGPNYGLLVPTGSTYNVDGWVPNQIGGSGSGGGGAPVGSLLLQTNGVNNGSQQLLNLVAGTGITIVDDGVGDVTISTGGSGGAQGPRFSVVDWYAWQAIVASRSGPATTINAAVTAGALLSPTQTEAATYNFVGNSVQGWGVNETQINTSDSPITVGQLNVWQARVALSNVGATDAGRHWIMLNSTPNDSVSSGGGAVTDSFVNGFTGDQDVIGFRFSPISAGDVNWQAYVGGFYLGSETIVDTGVPPTIDAVSHIFQIAVSGSNFVFSIDGAVVATIAIPATYQASFGTSHGTFGTVLTGDGNVNWNATWVYYELLK